MHHIDYFEMKSNDMLLSISTRVHLETLQCMTMRELRESVEIYSEFLKLKENDIYVLNNPERKIKQNLT